MTITRAIRALIDDPQRMGVPSCVLLTTSMRMEEMRLSNKNTETTSKLTSIHPGVITLRCMLPVDFSCNFLKSLHMQHNSFNGENSIQKSCNQNLGSLLAHEA